MAGPLAGSPRLVRSALLVCPSLGPAALLWHHRCGHRPRHPYHGGRSRSRSTTSRSQSLLVLGRSLRTPRLLGLLLLSDRANQADVEKHCANAPRGKGQLRSSLEGIKPSSPTRVKRLWLHGQDAESIADSAPLRPTLDNWLGGWQRCLVFCRGIDRGIARDVLMSSGCRRND